MSDPDLDPAGDDRPADATVGRWTGLVEAGSGAVSKSRQRAEAMLDKYRDRPLIDVVLRIYLRDRESAGTVVGSAIAFRMFLFFVPLLLFLVGIAGFLRNTVGRDDVASAGITGSLADQIDSALSQPSSTRWIAVLIGLFGMATTGRTLSKALVAASCLSWRLPVRPKASARVTGAVVGLISGVGLVALLVNRVRTELGVAVTGVSYIFALVVYVLGWILVSSLLPRRSDADPSALLPGALLVATTLVGMQLISQLYLPGRFSRASELYGGIGTTIVVLGWFFILGRAIVLGLTVNAVIDERFGTISQFVFSLPILRALPRRSPLVRRFFRLPEPAADAAPEGSDPTADSAT